MTESSTPRAVRPPRPQRIAQPRSTVQRAEPQREEAHDDVPRTEGVQRLQRVRKKTADRLYIEQSMIPPGVSYEWKAESVHGKKDPQYMSNLMDNHWREVPKERHPNLATRQDGLVLMERPKYLTVEARNEDYSEAVRQVQSVGRSIHDTPSDHLTRDHPSARRASYVKSERSSSLTTTNDGQLVAPE